MVHFFFQLQLPGQCGRSLTSQLKELTSIENFSEEHEGKWFLSYENFFSGLKEYESIMKLVRIHLDWISKGII